MRFLDFIIIASFRVPQIQSEIASQLSRRKHPVCRSMDSRRGTYARDICNALERSAARLKEMRKCDAGILWMRFAAQSVERSVRVHKPPKRSLKRHSRISSSVDIQP